MKFQGTYVRDTGVVSVRQGVDNPVEKLGEGNYALHLRLTIDPDAGFARTMQLYHIHGWGRVRFERFDRNKPEHLRNYWYGITAAWGFDGEPLRPHQYRDLPFGEVLEYAFKSVACLRGVAIIADWNTASNDEYIDITVEGLTQPVVRPTKLAAAIGRNLSNAVRRKLREIANNPRTFEQI